MYIEGKFGVVQSISSRHVPPHSCTTCLLNSFNEAKEYLKMAFNRDLEWDLEDNKPDEIKSYHTEDWTYARIEYVGISPFVREYWFSTMHDNR